MSEYLETLVKSMLDDNVSENDIQKVIEEVTKKSPLRQNGDIAVTTGGTEGTGTGEIVIDPTQVIDAPQPVEGVDVKEEVEPTCPPCNGKPVKPDENGTCPDCIPETTEQKIAKEDKGKVTEIPKEHPAKPKKELPKAEVKEIPYEHNYANKDLSIKPSFFDLDEDSAMKEFRSLFGGLGIKVESAQARVEVSKSGDKYVPTAFTNAVRITFPGGSEEGEVFNLGVWAGDKEAAAKNLNNAINNYIGNTEGKYEAFDIYADAVYNMSSEFDIYKKELAQDNVAPNTNAMEIQKLVSYAKAVGEFHKSEKFQQIQELEWENANNNINNVLAPLVNELEESIAHLPPQEQIDYRRSDEYVQKVLDGIDGLVGGNIEENSDYANQIEAYSNAAYAVYGGRIEKTAEQEAEEKHIPKWIHNRSIIKGLYKTFNMQFPLAASGQRGFSILENLRKLEEFEKGVYNLPRGSELSFIQSGSNVGRPYTWTPTEIMVDVNKDDNIPAKPYSQLIGLSNGGREGWGIKPKKKDGKWKLKNPVATPITWESVYGVNASKYKKESARFFRHDGTIVTLSKHVQPGPVDIQGDHTREDLLTKIHYIKQYYKNQYMAELANSAYYQGVMQSLGSPQFFTEESFDWTLDKWFEALGTQLTQMISAMATGSMSVKAQESSQIFVDGMYSEAAKLLGISVNEFKKLPWQTGKKGDPEQVEYLQIVLDSGLADDIYWEGHKHGGRAALLENVENAFIIFHGTKVIPAVFNFALIKASAGQYLKSLGKHVVLPMTGVSLLQTGIEVAQEYSGDIARKRLDIEMEGEMATRYKEVIFQTIITAPIIFIGMKGGTTAIQRIQQKVISFRNPNDARVYIDKQIAKRKEQLENGELKAKEYVKEVELLEASREKIEVVTSSKLSNKEKIETIKLEIKRQREIRDRGKLEAEIKKYDKDSDEYKELKSTIYRQNRKIKVARNEQAVIRARNNLDYDYEKRAAEINSKGVRKVKIFKTKAQLERYIKLHGNKGKFSKKALTRLLEGKSFEVVSADGTELVACKEILNDIVENLTGTKKEQYPAANAISHGILHFEMMDKTKDELRKMQDVIQMTLENAAEVDPHFRNIMKKDKNGLNMIERRQVSYLGETDSKTFVEEWFTTLSDIFQLHEMYDFSMDGAAYWSDIAKALEDFLKIPTGEITVESALEFIRKFNEGGKRNGRPVVHSWWLDDLNKPVIQTLWDLGDAQRESTGYYRVLDFINDQVAFKNKSRPKESKSTKHSGGTETLINLSEAKYGIEKYDVSEENVNIQDKIIKALSYVFENKEGQYTDERAKQIQDSVRTGETARYEDLFVLNNVKGVLTIINAKFDPTKSVSRYDFEAAVFAELGKIVKDYKPLLTEEEWNKFMSDAKEKNTIGYGEKADYAKFNNVLPSKVINKDIEGNRNITNPVNFWAYTKPILEVKRIPGIWDELVANAEQQYYVDLEEATHLAGDYDVETVLDLQQLVDNYKEISELKSILKVKNDDAFYIKVNNEVYRLMGGKIKNINPETFTQEFRNESRELFWKDLKGIVGTPKKFKVWLQKTDKDGITNAQKLYEVMPQAVMNTSYTEFTDLIKVKMSTKESEESLEVLVKNKYAGNDLRRKYEYTPEIEEQWINRIAPEVRPDMAQEGILKHLSDVIARDAVMQTIQSTKFKEEFGPANSDIMQVSQLLQRGIAVKFSNAVTGKIDVINHNKISGEKFSLMAARLIGLLERKGIDSLEEGIKLLHPIKVEQVVKDHVLSLWDIRRLADGEGVRYRDAIALHLANKYPKLHKKWVKSGSWSSQLNHIKTKAKKTLFKDISTIAKKLGPDVMNELGWDILALHLRYLDAAKRKQKVGWKKKSELSKEELEEREALLKKDPDARWQKNKDGTFVRGDFGDQLLDLVNSLPVVKLPLDIQKALRISEKMVGGKTLIGLTKDIQLELDKLRKEGKKRNAIIKAIDKKFSKRITAVNKANQKIMVFFNETIIKLFAQGKISDLSLLHLYEAQTGIQKGLRAYTTLELISILENGDHALDSRVGVEHLTDNAQTCIGLMKLALEYKSDRTVDLNGKLKDIFKDHNLWLTRFKYMEIVDKPGKNNPSKIRRVLFLNPTDLAKVYSPDGLTAREAILRKESMEELDEGTIQLLKENKEQRELREIIENIKYGPQLGATVADLDETILTDSENVVYATNPTTGEKRTIKSVDFVGVVKQLSKEGFEFDFSDYATIKGGKKGPFFSKLKNLYDTYGPDAVHILTARQPEAAVAIQMWLEQNGIKLPLKNIIGLGVEGVTVTGEMKADWIEQNLIYKGFTDILFADDAILNIEAVRKMFAKYPKGLLHKGGKAVLITGEKHSLSTEFNVIFEDVKGVDRKKRFSRVQAKTRGRKRGRFNIFISPSAEDFQGLLLQMTGKGEKGKSHIKWFNDNLVKPYIEGTDRIDADKVKLMLDYKKLVNDIPGIKKYLKNDIYREDGTKSNLTNDHAVRVYLWEKVMGINMVEEFGLSERDRDLLIAQVENDEELLSFAKRLGVISNQENGYVSPTEFWSIETIASDMHRIAMKLGRKENLKTFIKNKNEIFSEVNLNKIEAEYGPDFREALENILFRMENGINKNSYDQGRIERAWDKWVNNSVGAIMFMNMRSATLQTLSTLNYIDWKYNNPYAAARAFANQPEFWKTFVEIWNSPMLKQRRSGKRIGIHEAEISAVVVGSSNPAKAAISWLLEKGFIPTQLADNFAIAMGGASFLINARRHHAKTAPTLEEAEKRAWEDFRAKTQEAQQSSDPMYVSQQQASGLGRIILAFKNTPMQYARLSKKEIIKLINGTSENPAASIAKIGYYTTVQNFMFTALQTALFAALGEDDPDWEKKEDRVIKGMVDSILYGMGLHGAVIATVKNGIITFVEQEEKGWNADHTYTVLQFANLSPTIGSKLRKIYAGIQTLKYNKETIDYMSMWDPQNPAWQALGNFIEAFTNIPTGEVAETITNLMSISNSENEFYQNLALLLGWNTWDVDVETKSSKLREKAKGFIRDSAKEAKNIEAYNKELKEEKKDIKCVAASKNESGRCGNPVLPGEMYCTVHEKVLHREDDKLVRCKGKRTNGEQCKMMTTNKSGYCVYHD